MHSVAREKLQSYLNSYKFSSRESGIALMHNTNRDEKHRKRKIYAKAIEALQLAKEKKVSFAVQAQRNYDGTVDECSPVKTATISFEKHDFIHIHAKFDDMWWIGRIVRTGTDIGFVPTAKRLSNYMVEEESPTHVAQSQEKSIWEPPCPYVVVPSTRPIILLGPSSQHSRLTQLLHLALREEILHHFGKKIKYLKTDLGCSNASADKNLSSRWLRSLREVENRMEDEQREVELVWSMTSRLHLLLLDSPYIHTPDDIQHIPISPIFVLLRVSDNKFEMIIEENGLAGATRKVCTYLEEYLKALTYVPRADDNNSNDPPRVTFR